jgi:hypothetical protein
MSEEKLQMLESLLGELGQRLKGRLVIMTGLGIDGFGIGVYDNQGQQLGSSCGPTILKAYQNLINPLPNGK